MSDIETLLKEINFSKYEAKAFLTLVKYNSLSAREISQYSGVLQPKIYQTMDRLYEKGFIKIISQGKKKIYKIKKKSVIVNKFKDMITEFQEIGNQLLGSIEIDYDTKESVNVPFIAIEGEQKIINYIIALIDETKENIIGILQQQYLNNLLTNHLNLKSNSIQVRFLFHDLLALEKFKSKCPNISLYRFTETTFSLVKYYLSMIAQFTPSTQSNNFTYKDLKTFIEEMTNNFSLIIFDNQKSIFILPFPISNKIALISTMPDLLNFQLEGLNFLLDSSELS